MFMTAEAFSASEQRCRRVETVLGQLVERYHAKRVWARDAWHLWSRWQRAPAAPTW
jgi:hypothetical protein